MSREPMFAKYDAETAKWFSTRPGAQTTVMCCEECGLWYKPMLGHKCKRRTKCTGVSGSSSTRATKK